ncbi:MAG: hypothetical protein C5B49_11675 [Bdellovibrio sp.]|nr:MAG: hypothetical protein C5B49_11675 [Bdellovibrio sp.]
MRKRAAICLIFLLTFRTVVGASGLCSRVHKSGLLYATDTLGPLYATLTSREELLAHDKTATWREAKAKFVRNGAGEEELYIEGLQVMSEFEAPYMREIAREVTIHGGKILNVGFGLGIIDREIEALRDVTDISEHHIIELNDEVADRAESWRKQQRYPERIFIHRGHWQDVVRELARAGILFDGVAYDAFPLKKADLHRDFIPFFETIMDIRIVRPVTGVISFYLDSTDGLGRRFKEFASSLGVHDFQERVIPISLPAEETQYWRQPFFITPVLGHITYGTPL